MSTEHSRSPVVFLPLLFFLATSALVLTIRPLSVEFAIGHILVCFVYSFGLMGSGLLLARALNPSVALVWLCGFPIGLMCHLVFFGLFRLVHAPALFLFAPALVSFCLLAWACFKTGMPRLTLKPLTCFALAVACVALAVYRHLLMDQGNNLAAAQPAIWIDLAWFMGNAASSKLSVLPVDYRILGEPLGYHFLYTDITAFLSLATRVHLFEILTRTLPVLLCTHLLCGFFASGLSIFKSELRALLFVLLAIFIASPFYASALIGGFDTTLNLITSPSVPLSLLIWLPVLSLLEISEKLSRTKTAALFAAIFFLLAGSKISTAAVAGLGLGAVALEHLRRNRKSDLLVVTATAACAAIVGYLFFNYRPGSIGPGQRIHLSFPNHNFMAIVKSPPFSSLHLADLLQGQNVFVLPFLALACLGVVGLKYLPWLLPLLQRGTLRTLFGSLAGRYGFICAAIGIALGFTLDIDGNQIHFFHPGLIMLAWSAAYVFPVNAMRWVILAILVPSALPIWQDRTIEEFQGLKHGKPTLAPDELSHDHLHAYAYIREHAAATDVVVTPQLELRAFGDKFKALAIFSSAFTERQSLLEGWAFTGASLDGKETARLQKLKQIHQGVYQGKAPWQQVLDGPDLQSVRWVIWDTRLGGALPLARLDGWQQVLEAAPLFVLKRSGSASSR